MDLLAQQQVVVVRIASLVAEINRPRQAGCGEVVFEFFARAHLSSEIPRLKSLGLFAQVIVHESSGRTGWWCSGRVRLRAGGITGGNRGAHQRAAFQGFLFWHSCLWVVVWNSR